MLSRKKQTQTLHGIGGFCVRPMIFHDNNNATAASELLNEEEEYLNKEKVNKNVKLKKEDSDNKVEPAIVVNDKIDNDEQTGGKCSKKGKNSWKKNKCKETCKKKGKPKNKCKKKVPQLTKIEEMYGKNFFRDIFSNY